MTAHTAPILQRRLAMTTLQPGLLPLFAVLAIVLAAVPAQAQMTPLEDLRVLTANAYFLPNYDEQELNPPGFFARLEGNLYAFAPNPDPEGGGHVSADAYQLSEFSPASIYYAGTT